jgi:hypothetical protein
MIVGLGRCSPEDSKKIRRREAKEFTRHSANAFHVAASSRLREVGPGKRHQQGKPFVRLSFHWPHPPADEKPSEGVHSALCERLQGRRFDPLETRLLCRCGGRTDTAREMDEPRSPTPFRRAHRHNVFLYSVAVPVVRRSRSLLTWHGSGFSSITNASGHRWTRCVVPESCFVLTS